MTQSWQQVPGTGEVISVCALDDGTIVGIGADHRLYARPNLAGWIEIPDSGDVIAATVLTDGTILGVGTDARRCTGGGGRSPAAAR